MSDLTDPQFLQAIATNLAYWQQFVAAHQDQPSLHIEHASLLRAIEFGLSLPATQEAAATLTLAAFPLVLHRGYWQTWLPIYAHAIANQRARPGDLLCRLLNRYGQLLRLTGQRETAVAIHQQAAATAQELSDPLALADAQFNLSEDYRHLRQYEMAEAYGAQALQTFRAAPNTAERQAPLLNNLGLVAWETGQLPLAETHLTAAVALWRQVANPTECARSLNNLAVVFQEQRKFDLALATFQEAAAQLVTTSSELDKCRVHISRGALHFHLEQYELAEAAFRQADTQALRQSGDQRTRAILAQNMGNVLLKQKRYAEAEYHLRRGLELWQGLAYPVSLANTLGTLAEVLTAQQDTAAARLLYDQALTLLNEEDGPRAGRLRAEFSEKRQTLS